MGFLLKLCVVPYSRCIDLQPFYGLDWVRKFSLCVGSSVEGTLQFLLSFWIQWPGDTKGLLGTQNGYMWRNWICGGFIDLNFLKFCGAARAHQVLFLSFSLSVCRKFGTSGHNPHRHQGAPLKPWFCILRKECWTIEIGLYRDLVGDSSTSRPYSWIFLQVSLHCPAFHTAVCWRLWSFWLRLDCDVAGLSL